MENRLSIPRNDHDWNEVFEIGNYIKRFLLLVLITMSAIIVVGAAAWLRVTMVEDKQLPSSGMIGQVQQQYVEGMFAEELPSYTTYNNTDSFFLNQLGLWAIEGITNLSLNDHSSLIKDGLPLGQVTEQFYLMTKGSASDPSVAPLDDHHFAHDGLNEQEMNQILNDLDGQQQNTAATDQPDSNAGAITSGNNKDSVVFIYHSHNRESWNSEVLEGEKNANSKTQNITLVGKRLAIQLDEKGIGAMHSDTDYSTTVPNYDWNYSYKFSRKTVKEAIASNEKLQFFFDIHRDSQQRKYTTAEIDGISYAQVYFIIGQRNSNWKENEAFATKIHEKLEKKYPGLSRGIWGKTASSGNAEYNQSLAGQNVLIEIGGVDNTLEESYRTADVLAEVIAELIEESTQKNKI